ncbi:MAG: hypothetical protein HC767_06285 [Akkermansiaceae bacterium]|nr:hypothetical protein [Akkermansiaceae bacterium]
MSNTFMSMGVSLTNASSLHTTEVKVWTPRAVPPSPPVDTSLKSCIKFMHEQLDCFGDENPLLGKWLLLGDEERRTGGATSLLLPLRCYRHLFCRPQP